MSYRLKSNQSGFTLVEIAIVLVIVGLLLGGVLKGQELIENSRIKSIVSDMKSVQAAYNGYIDRYRTIPGDELVATMGARGWPVTVGGNGDGVLTIPAATVFTNGAAGEQAALWAALRGSGLLQGDASAGATPAGLPHHAAGGLLGVGSDLAGIYGQTGVSVCASGLSPKQAAGVDSLIDGAPPANQQGNNVGSLRGAPSAAVNPLAPTNATPANTPYVETQTVTWTVCMKM